MLEQNMNTSTTQNITRGVCRLLGDMGYRVVREFKLKSGRRVDVAGLDRSGKFVVVEVKSSVADFRSDGKWQEYLEFSDQFYFAVNVGFPAGILPEDHGLIIADGFGAVIERRSMTLVLNPQRRRAQTLRFARTAADRLETLLDPGMRTRRSG
jgi:hypothetical protein